jgi:hypothetical protein
MDAPKRSSAVLWAVVVLVLLPVVYLASIGPIAWVVVRNGHDVEMYPPFVKYTRPAAWLCWLHVDR